MMYINEVSLTGQTVELQPLTLDHVSGLYEAGRFQEVWALTQGNIASTKDAEAYIHKALGTKDALPFVVIERASGQIVGSTRFYDISQLNRSLEIGSTWLTPKVWRTRVNTECKYLLLKHCFEHLGTIRVQLKTDARNIRSQKAIERLGASKEGILRSHMILPDGYVRDSVYYSIIAQEWPTVKERLEAMLER